MNNAATQKLCLGLLAADTEQEVVNLLASAGYWDNPKAWRLYGDRDGNYATIGNQQSRPEAALVEKIVNCVDARLMNECLIRKIDPATPAAPPSLRHAVARFFEERELQGDVGGTVGRWPPKRQLEQSQFITVAATGSRQTPSLVIADCGEGQTPARMPDTFLSIDRSNKLRIPFVQGKFNMGGTGALKFCGQSSLQMIITRRNPAFQDAADPTSAKWGFTVVRRERPTESAGEVRNSVFRYLAPLESDAGRGEVLSFDADTLPLLPEGNVAFTREMAHGSCIKLYEYDMRGFKSHILMKGGLLSRLEILLPEIALPVRVHECRDFRGHAGSFANTLVGLTARLAEDRAGNLEDGYPTSVNLTVHGQEMIATIYAFKGDKAESYRTNEGIIFTINGQTHGAIPKTFFSRSSVKMSRLAKALLLIVDCSRLSVDAREDLFMNSRDRLSNGELRKAIEEELEELIRNHPGLRELRDRRRSEEIAERLEDSKPLEEVLESILKSSPTLERLFLLGQRLSRPHRAGADGEQEGGGQGSDGESGAFVGKVHPTFFRFRRKKDGDRLLRNAEHGRRCRIRFETDVVNDYFSRDMNRGRYHVEVIAGSLDGAELDNSLTLHDGIANWSLNLPTENVAVGDTLTIQCTVVDDTLAEPFTNIATFQIVPATPNGGGQGGRESSAGSGAAGAGGVGSTGTDGRKGVNGPPESAGIKLPEIIEVKEGDSSWETHGFNDHTACMIVEDSEGEGDEERSVFTFYVNVDNICLRTEMKGGVDDAPVKKAKFVFGNVLLGLALIHDHRSRERVEPNGNPGDNEAPEATIDGIVERTTRAVAPFLLPMIDYLGSLSAEEVAGLAQTGDEE